MSTGGGDAGGGPKVVASGHAGSWTRSVDDGRPWGDSLSASAGAVEFRSPLAVEKEDDDGDDGLPGVSEDGGRCEAGGCVDTK
jgi:hypothetical protein